MKLSAKWLVAVAAVCSIAVAYGQSGVTGAWKGKLIIDASKMPKNATPDQKRMIDMGMEQAKKINFALNLKGNKTFTMKVTGLPAMGGTPSKDQTVEGTWSQKGTVLTLKATKQNGAAPKGENKPQELKVLDGGKKLELTAMGMGPSKVVFTR